MILTPASQLSMDGRASEVDFYFIIVILLQHLVHKQAAEGESEE